MLLVLLVTDELCTIHILRERESNAVSSECRQTSQSQVELSTKPKSLQLCSHSVSFVRGVGSTVRARAHSGVVSGVQIGATSTDKHDVGRRNFVLKNVVAPILL